MYAYIKLRASGRISAYESGGCTKACQIRSDQSIKTGQTLGVSRIRSCGLPALVLYWAWANAVK